MASSAFYQTRGIHWWKGTFSFLRNYGTASAEERTKYRFTKLVVKGRIYHREAVDPRRCEFAL